MNKSINLNDLFNRSTDELRLLMYDDYLTIYDQLPRRSRRLEIINVLLPELGYRWPTTDQTNPFGDRGCIRHLDRYLIRQPLTRHLIDQLRQGNSVSLVGESQTGKSSLLWYLQQHGPDLLARPASDIIVLNLELVKTAEDFYEELCEELEIATTTTVRRLWRHLRKSNRRIILCLDEMERLVQLDEFVRSGLRAMIDGAAAPMSLVTASRSSLKRLFPDEVTATSPIYNLCHRLDLRNFSREEAFALVQHRLLPRRCTLPTEAIRQAWQETQGHPMQLQQALKRVFDETARRNE